MNRSTLAITLSFLLLAGVAGVARAGDESRGERVGSLQREGVKHFDAGRFEHALASYQEAHAIWPLAALSFMEARCLEALGRAPDAIVVLQRALREDPEGVVRGRIEQKLIDLRRAVAPGHLLLHVTPDGAEIRVDGALRGHAPMPGIDLAAGVHTVDVRLLGYHTRSDEVFVPGSEKTSHRVDLVVVQEPQRWYERPWGWATFGLGVASGVAAGALLGVADRERREVRDALDNDPITSIGRQEAIDQLDTADQEELAAYVLFGVGGAALVTSIVLFALPEEEPGPYTAVVPLGLPDGLGMSWVGRF